MVNSCGSNANYEEIFVWGRKPFLQPRKVKTSIGYGVHQNGGRPFQPIDAKRFKGASQRANQYQDML
ncbi:MAG TPA: hypothetical protein VF123_11195 [Candidatus Sulfotelmatobacter sp.]